MVGPLTIASILHGGRPAAVFDRHLPRGQQPDRQHCRAHDHGPACRVVYAAGIPVSGFLGMDVWAGGDVALCAL